MPFGPPPLPTNVKILRGNPGKRKLNQNEPQPVSAADIPDPPDYLHGYAAAEWRRISSELHRLRLLTIVDLHPLAAYCVAYARWRTAEEALKKIARDDPITRGLLVKRGGNSSANPLVWIASQASKDMVRYAAEFGLTPAARSRIAAGVADQLPESKFSGLLA